MRVPTCCILDEQRMASGLAFQGKPRYSSGRETELKPPTAWVRIPLGAHTFISKALIAVNLAHPEHSFG